MVDFGHAMAGSEVGQIRTSDPLAIAEVLGGLIIYRCGVSVAASRDPQLLLVDGNVPGIDPW